MPSLGKAMTHLRSMHIRQECECDVLPVSEMRINHYPGSRDDYLEKTRHYWEVEARLSWCPKCHFSFSTLRDRASILRPTIFKREPQRAIMSWVVGHVTLMRYNNTSVPCVSRASCCTPSSGVAILPFPSSPPARARTCHP